MSDIVRSDAVRVVTICGSLRNNSFNAALARAAEKLAPIGMSVTPAPPIADIPLYNFDIESAGFPAAVTTLGDAMRAADGILICAPEYNWSIPAALKNAIDWVSRLKDQPLLGKPVALQSAATGRLGGSRMQSHLRHALTSLDAHLFGKPEVVVTFAAQKFDDKTLELKDQPTIDMIKQQLAAFEKYVRKFGGK